MYMWNNYGIWQVLGTAQSYCLFQSSKNPFGPANFGEILEQSPVKIFWHFVISGLKVCQKICTGLNLHNFFGSHWTFCLANQQSFAGHFTCWTFHFENGEFLSVYERQDMCHLGEALNNGWIGHMCFLKLQDFRWKVIEASTFSAPYHLSLPPRSLYCL